MKKIIIAVVALLVLAGGGIGAYFFVFSDKKEDKPEPPVLFEYEIPKSMTYLANDEKAKNKRQVYVQFTPVIFYRDEETLEVLTKNKTIIAGEIEKYFNTKTLSEVQKMRGVNVEGDKDRIEIQLEEKVKEITGEMGVNIMRVSLLGFVIN